MRDRHIQYKFTVERNITILRGDSATGKTTLINMIDAYQRGGESSGVSVVSDKRAVVLDAYNWQANLAMITDSIVFIDEGDAFVRSEEFARAAQNSDNYYVLATRSSLFNLPYSIKEIYGIRNRSGNRYQGTKRIYSEFYRLYKAPSPEAGEIPKPELVLVEDSNSGYEFFSSVSGEYGIPCISAGGKSNIYAGLMETQAETVLVIADGAAFGPEIERVLSLSRIKNLVLFMPESFEWLILSSGIVDGAEDILADPSEHIESSEYFSWERFFTALLADRTKDSYLAYSKKKLNPVYLQPGEREKILTQVQKITK